MQFKEQYKAIKEFQVIRSGNQLPTIHSRKRLADGKK